VERYYVSGEPRSWAMVSGRLIAVHEILAVTPDIQQDTVGNKTEIGVTVFLKYGTTLYIPGTTTEYIFGLLEEMVKGGA
jgi:hypothetical protein